MAPRSIRSLRHVPEDVRWKETADEKILFYRSDPVDQISLSHGQSHPHTHIATGIIGGSITIDYVRPDNHMWAVFPTLPYGPTTVSPPQGKT